MFVTNGAGSGSFQQVPSAAIASAGVLVFQSQKFHFRDEVSSGTSSQGPLTNGIWNTRRLQTAKTNDLAISFGANQFVLVAGTYWIEAWANVFITSDAAVLGIAQGLTQLRLSNVTDGLTAAIGPSSFVLSDNQGQTEFHCLQNLRQQFTVVGTKVFELQNYVQNINGTSFVAGVAANTGENEVYADVIIWKLS